MHGKTILLRTAMLIVACALAACFPGPEKVGELARASMQQYFRSNPEFQGSGIEVVRVRVTGGGDRQFAALASVSYAGTTHEIPVTVIVDGINLQWFAEPGAFAFVSQTSAPPAQPPRE